MSKEELINEHSSHAPKMISSDFLISDEHVFLETRPLIWPKLIGPTIGILFGIGLYISLGFLAREFASLDTMVWLVLKWVSVAIIAIGLLSLLTTWLKYRNTAYIITNKRVMLQSGVIGRSYTDCSLGKIQNLFVDIPVLGRSFNYGTIKMATSGTASFEICWENVKSPVKVQQEINEAMQKLG